jgi:hypothetical protein
MGRHTGNRALLVASLAAMVFVRGDEVFGRVETLLVQPKAIIAGQDHRVLREYVFGRAGSRLGRPLDDTIRSLMVRNAPASLGKGCNGYAGRWTDDSSGIGSPEVRLIFLEENKESGSARGLAAYGCSSEASESRGQGSDERLAGLIIDRSESRIFAVPFETDQSDCEGRVKIGLEKELKIGGRSIIGLKVATSGGAETSPSSGNCSEEKVDFFLFDEQNARPAGSVLKTRKSVTGESRKVTQVYEAAIVLKKDMKGNIIGILSPYAIKSDGKVSVRGMFRYGWDSDKGKFVRE